MLGENQAEKRALEEWMDATGTRTIMIGYFLRKPSAWGKNIDARALYQVIGDKEVKLRAPKADLKTKAKNALRCYPKVYGVARSVFGRPNKRRQGK